MAYSDTQIQPVTCQRCKGSKKEPFTSKYPGDQCGKCHGKGTVYPPRKAELSRAFAVGDLPEQDHAPKNKWCGTCRPGGVFKECSHSFRLAGPCKKCQRERCLDCGGRSILG